MSGGETSGLVSQVKSYIRPYIRPAWLNPSAPLRPPPPQPRMNLGLKAVFSFCNSHGNGLIEPHHSSQSHIPGPRVCPSFVSDLATRLLSFQLGSFMDQTHHSGVLQCKVCRKQIVSPGDLSHVNSNFNEKLHS